MSRDARGFETAIIITSGARSAGKNTKGVLYPMKGVRFVEVMH